MSVESFIPQRCGHRVAVLSVVSLITLGSGPCGGGPEPSDPFDPFEPPSVATVRLTPPLEGLVAGASLQFIAEPLDASGNVLSGRTFSWTTSNPAVATVAPGGLATAVAGGTTTITATTETVSASATLEVFEDVSGVYVGVLSGTVSGVQMTGTFTLTLSQTRGDISGTYTLAANLFDGFFTVPIGGDGPITGLVQVGRNPSVEITVTVPGCPLYSADFVGALDSETEVLTASGPVDILNTDCTIFLRYPTIMVLTR